MSIKAKLVKDDDDNDNDTHIIIIPIATCYKLDGPGIEYH
jgi:hypothetical protein